jgi:hypothetical protein
VRVKRETGILSTWNMKTKTDSYQMGDLWRLWSEDSRCIHPAKEDFKQDVKMY